MDNATTIPSEPICDESGSPIGGFFLIFGYVLLSAMARRWNGIEDNWSAIKPLSKTTKTRQLSSQEMVEWYNRVYWNFLWLAIVVASLIIGGIQSNWYTGFLAIAFWAGALGYSLMNTSFGRYEESQLPVPKYVYYMFLVTRILRNWLRALFLFPGILINVFLRLLLANINDFLLARFNIEVKVSTWTFWKRTLATHDGTQALSDLIRQELANGCKEIFQKEIQIGCDQYHAAAMSVTELMAGTVREDWGTADPESSMSQILGSCPEGGPRNWRFVGGNYERVAQWANRLTGIDRAHSFEWYRHLPQTGKVASAQISDRISSIQIFNEQECKQIRQWSSIGKQSGGILGSCFAGLRLLQRAGDWRDGGDWRYGPFTAELLGPGLKKLVLASNDQAQAPKEITDMVRLLIEKSPSLTEIQANLHGSCKAAALNFVQEWMNKVMGSIDAGGARQTAKGMEYLQDPQRQIQNIISDSLQAVENDTQKNLQVLGSVWLSGQLSTDMNFPITAVQLSWQKKLLELVVAVLDEVVCSIFWYAGILVFALQSQDKDFGQEIREILETTSPEKLFEIYQALIGIGF